MKKLIALLLASGMVAAIPATVLAQAAAPAMPAASSIEPGVNAGAATGAQFTWTDLLASVNAQAAGSSQTDWATLIGGVKADSNIQVIDVFSLEGSPGQGDSSLQAALDSSGQSMSSLQSAVSGNQTLVDKLKAQGYAAADVVAITSNPDSSFSIYVRPAAGAGMGASSSSAMGG
jgi:hypothetical protein